MNPKLKKCKHCKQAFLQRMPMQTYCSFDCNSEAKKARDSKKPIKEPKPKQPKPISQINGRNSQYPRLCKLSRGRTSSSDYHACERCGLRSWSERHHIRWRVGKLLNDVSKIIRLCRDCHSYIHLQDNSKAMKDNLVSIVSRIIKNI